MSGNDDVKVNVWTGEDLSGVFHTMVAMPNGSSIFTPLHGIKIKNGDCVTVDYGRSIGVVTRSGKGYESEFKFGRIVLCGTGVSFELNESNKIGLKSETKTKSEFDKQVEIQKVRSEAEITEAKDCFMIEYMKANQRKTMDDIIAKEKRDNQLKQVLGDMEKFFKNKKI